MAEFTARRLHPKLRVIANGSEAVNAMRAGSSNCVATSAVAVSASQAGGTRSAEVALGTREAFSAGQLDGEVFQPAQRAPQRVKLDKAGVANASFVNVFVETKQADPRHESPVRDVTAKIQAILNRSPAAKGIPAAMIPRRNFIAATVPVSALTEIAGIDGVTFVHSADSLTFRFPTADPRPGKLAPTPREVKVDGKLQKGAGVIIGIIDVGGFDFAHEDFLDAQGHSRFLSIWDQGGTYRKPPAMFDYGSEFDQARLDAALLAQKTTGIPATLIEKQSQQELESHGTHVASIAAGKSGVCPEALIAAVLVSIPMPRGDREARQWTFSDSSRIVHAVEYLLDLAERHNKPISINISLGTNGGPHDGSNGPCRWIDSSLSIPGRSICIAAGNAGQEKGLSKDDLGWIMGRIHTSGQVPSRGLDIDLEWIVVGDGIADVSENELEIWYGAQDRITVAVQPPGSTQWYTVAPREFIENKRLPSGTVLSVYNELYHPTNGDNYIAIYLSPFMDPANFAPVAPGVWKVRLHGDEIRDGRFHAWIERDDPMEMDRRENLRAYRFPSFFSEASNVDSHSLGSLGCAHRVVAVANVDGAAGRVNISSSQGPTRDGRNKPDIAAPGTNIVAAKGFDKPGEYVSMTGTSMASPYVCGVIGQMLAAKPNLNAAQCLGILRRTARPLPSHGYQWRNDAGYGVVDAAAAIQEAKVFDERVPL